MHDKGIMKKTILIPLTVIIASIFLFSNFSQSEVIKYSNVDSDITDALFYQKEFPVVVVLKDDSNINYEKSMSDSEKFRTYKKKAEHFSATEDDVLSIFDESEFRLSDKFNSFNGFAGYITNSGLKKIVSHPKVSAIHSSKRDVELFLDTSVPLINGTSYWNLGYTGKGKTICIIDSGINYSHPDFGGCSNTSFLEGNCKKVIGGYDFVNNDTDPMDDFGHGTHVAGVAAANGTFKGVAPDANIVMMKIFNGTGESVDDNNILRAIEWCLNNRTKYNITVISMSFGTYTYTYSDYCDSDYTDWSIAINSAISNDIFVDAASGNKRSNTNISSPACIEKAVAVGATNDDDEIWDTGEGNCGGTARNALVDLMAPGENINASTLIGYSDPCYSDSDNDGYMNVSGTSAAAPHVAGAAALLQQANPDFTPSEIENRLKKTGKLIHDIWTGLDFPRIDIYSALALDVYGLSEVYSDTKYKVYRFNLRNYNQSAMDVMWYFDIGNGTIINNTESISLDFNESIFTFFEQNYSSWDGDFYTINATAIMTSGDIRDTETMSVAIGDIIAYDLMNVYNNSKEYVFLFKILNNLEEEKSVNWTFNTGEEPISSTELISLNPSKDVFVFFHYNYTSGGSYTVNATAFNGSYSDYTEDVTINVPY